MRRVVITGIGMLTPLGNSPREVVEALRAGKSGVTRQEDWRGIERMRTSVGGSCAVELPPFYDYKRTRSMGRVAVLATYASDLAIDDAGLKGSAELTDGSTGVAYGSCSGSTVALTHFAELIVRRSIAGIAGTTYLKMMPHTTAAHVALTFGITGRLIPTSSACTSASQAMGFSYEAIKSGAQSIMIAGGSEEIASSIAAIFDVMGAATVKRDGTPAPFDPDRDGLAVAEGGCTVVLEELEHALARGAVPYAEIVGFATTSDGKHLVHSNPEQIERTIRMALRDASLPPEAITYVNAHATGTVLGDRSESYATHAVFGDRVPVSSLKGHFGHTLGACGSLEAFLSATLMREGEIPPTLNHRTIDPECAPLDYVREVFRPVSGEYTMSNNFAFGGVNTSLVLRTPSDARRYR